MLSQLEQACKIYSTESSGGLIEFDSNWQHIFVTALTFHLDQAILNIKIFGNKWYHYMDKKIDGSLKNLQDHNFVNDFSQLSERYAWAPANRNNFSKLKLLL